MYNRFNLNNMIYKQGLSKKIYWVVGIIVLGIGAYLYFGSGAAPSQETVSVTKRTIIQEVSATGNVKPVENVDLAFETGGRISNVSVQVGDYVSPGQVIAWLDTTQLNAQLDKANADLASQKAALNKATLDLQNYYGSIVTTVNAAYTSANDAVRIKIYPLFSDDETSLPKLTFDSTKSQEKTTVETERYMVRDILNRWLLQVSNLTYYPPVPVVADSMTQSLENALSDSKKNLYSIYDFLNTLMDVTINAASLPAATLASYKTDINGARGEIDSAAANVTTLMQNIASQKAAVTSKQADVQSYQASVDNINAQISKTVLRSPISGTVTKQDAKVGEIASANTILVSIISSGGYEIDSNIPEVDISRIKVRDDAKVTLDAYGNDVVFAAKVVSIDPAETVIEGVSTYLTKLHFTQPDPRIKPGMTANIDIVSASHENALSLPQRAVQKSGGREFVLIYKGVPGSAKNVSSTEERDVVTGLRGSDGYVEILSGMSEGEKVVMPSLGK